MSRTVIKVENLSKQYRLGNVGVSSFRDDAIKLFAKLRGRENPFFKTTLENERNIQSENKYVWSLRDINFEVKQGDVLGIIGRNGAGKSTLLKILSKITLPTIGSVKSKGRIASLLEVGTGFHPELTGRENIFLNGAILGMKKQEIKSKLDEIIAFAGIERYIDTPVKRYSSGMYVRLAFAVAAHLENEILIIDEVLAVGDAEFQKKCLGKMGDVSKGEGRTVLFVSHNMSAVNKLCNKSMFLKNGLVRDFGETHSIVNEYLIPESNTLLDNQVSNDYSIRRGNGIVRFESVIINDNKNSIDYFEDIKIDLTFKSYEKVKDLYLSLVIYNSEGFEKITDTGLIEIEHFLEKDNVYTYKLIIEKSTLRTGLYPIYLWIGKKGNQFEDNIAYDLLDKLYFLNIKSNLGVDFLGYDFTTPHGYFNLKATLLKC
jgi:lipopolysaccharide transport system ATP-binding protein